jgi:2'-5' RNA ligase
LKKQSISGNFTKKNNFHLTLVFIGEVDASGLLQIIEMLDQVSFEPFSFQLDQIGKFYSKGSGDIFWVGVNSVARLEQVYHRFVNELCKLQFSIEIKNYNPHITLGRKVVIKDAISMDILTKHTLKTEIIVNEITLFESKRIDNELVYQELYTK